MTAADSPRLTGWPVRLGPVQTKAGAVCLRPLRRSDGVAWRELRLRDEALIRPWEPSSPLNWAQRHTRQQWWVTRRTLRRAVRINSAWPFAIVVDDRFVGQITIGGVTRGPVQSAWVGYWVESAVSRQGVATAAVALATSFGFSVAGLHRIEATIAPANHASRAVVEHLGFRHEGLLRRYLDIDGSWRDHDLFALTTEEVHGVTSLLQRWKRPGSVDH